jgi:hypothetical protein
LKVEHLQGLFGFVWQEHYFSELTDPASQVGLFLQFVFRAPHQAQVPITATV